MTLFDLHLIAVCALGGWLIGSTIADPSYTKDAFRGIWQAWVDLCRLTRTALVRRG